MQESELVARLANAFVEYDRARKRSEAAGRDFYRLTAMEEMYGTMRHVLGGDCSAIRLALETTERKILESVKDWETREKVTKQALRQISRIGMLADGRTLAQIDEHFRIEDAEEDDLQRFIRDRIADSIDNR